MKEHTENPLIKTKTTTTTKIEHILDTYFSAIYFSIFKIILCNESILVNEWKDEKTNATCKSTSVNEIDNCVMRKLFKEEKKYWIKKIITEEKKEEDESTKNAWEKKIN